MQWECFIKILFKSRAGLFYQNYIQMQIVKKIVNAFFHFQLVFNSKFSVISIGINFNKRNKLKQTIQVHLRLGNYKINLGS